MKYQRGKIETPYGEYICYYPLERCGLAIERYRHKQYRVTHLNTKAYLRTTIPSLKLAKSALEAVKGRGNWDSITKVGDEVREILTELQIAKVRRIIDLVCKYQQPFDEVLDFTDKLMGGNVDVSQKN